MKYIVVERSISGTDILLTYGIFDSQSEAAEWISTQEGNGYMEVCALFILST
jgi:hypothetical protein